MHVHDDGLVTILLKTIKSKPSIVHNVRLVDSPNCSGSRSHYSDTDSRYEYDTH